MIATAFGTPFRRILAVVLALLLATFGLVDTAGAKPKGKASKIHNGVMVRGELRCGVSQFAPGFSVETAPGVFEGFDVDMCRAVAAAVLGDADAVEFVPLSPAERFTAVTDGTVDVLMRITTNTLSRDALAKNGGAGVNFGPTYFYDGTGVLARSSVATAFTDLDGEEVCLINGTSSKASFEQAASDAGITPIQVAVASIGEVIDALDDGGCDAAAITDRTGLTGLQTQLTVPGDFVILGDTLSKEPLAPVVTDGDDGWLAIVSWVVNSMIFAEEAQVTLANIDTVLAGSPSFEVSFAFGDDADFTGAALGLDADWAYRVIKQVGNYGEIYEDNLTPIGLARAGTLNDSYLDGGLIYAPPIR
jgi:general L-amino acid transport system substrate-binding protein